MTPSLKDVSVSADERKGKERGRNVPREGIKSLRNKMNKNSVESETSFTIRKIND